MSCMMYAFSTCFYMLALPLGLQHSKIEVTTVPSPTQMEMLAQSQVAVCKYSLQTPVSEQPKEQLGNRKGRETKNESKEKEGNRKTKAKKRNGIEKRKQRKGRESKNESKEKEGNRKTKAKKRKGAMLKKIPTVAPAPCKIDWQAVMAIFTISEEFSA